MASQGVRALRGQAGKRCCEAVRILQIPGDPCGLQGAFAGNEFVVVESPVVLKASRVAAMDRHCENASQKALPEPRPNDAMLPAEPGMSFLRFGSLRHL